MSDIMDKAKDFAAEALDKTGDIVEVGKLKAKIASKKSEIEKLEKQMGLYMYELYKDNDGSLEPEDEGRPKKIYSELRDMCRQIDGAYDEIALLESKIDSLKEKI